ncbi:PIN domain-containing protein [Rarobacter faecitabidus]|uniref:PIN domain-containing protein n=1 Tax=Rarobacter faecitabidus TaxID=13243 RepID=UPI001B85FE6C|nr:PIN domain-containing protein [Rarobacter faecitabidus]
MRFVDTNILLYAIATAPQEQAKAGVARDLLEARDLVLSTQVLQEFVVQATRASRPDRLTLDQAADLVEGFARFTVVDVTLEVVRTALAVQDRYGISYWDAAIIAAARAGRCGTLLSEDLSHGQDYGGVQVVNPFAGAET